MLGSLCGTALFSIIGTGIYYTSTITPFTLSIGAFLGVIVTLVATQKKYQTPFVPLQKNFHSPQSIFLFIVGLIALFSWWSAILAINITDAVRSPWLVLQPITIIAPAIACMTSFLLLWRKHHTIGSILLFASLFSLFISAAVLFPLGYGFDPFLHRATMEHIALHGTITPKPFYYIGEYALELLVHFFTGIGIFSIDTVLVPLIAAATFTIAARRLPLGISILLLDLSNFTTTTPQALAYLFALLTILATPSVPHAKRDLIAPSIFALAAFLTHPIAGVPAILFVLFIAINQWRRFYKLLLTIFALFALPIMFLIQALLSHANLLFTPKNLWRWDLLPLQSFFWSQGNPWLDILYLIIHNSFFIVIILAGVGAYTSRHTPSVRNHTSSLMTTILIVNFIIVSLGIDFAYLIDYERQYFAQRFLVLASIFALPLAEEGLMFITKKLTAHQNVSQKISLTFSYALFIMSCAAVYALYPRHDGYERSAAFNVSQADIDTVYAIHNQETPEADYIVLANQATSAAALQEFGFRKYYHQDIFYYPIPTGGPLYQSYLAMVESNPSRKTMNDAMDLAGVKKAYFVVSDYWWRSDVIIENTKKQTDQWFSLDHQKNTVFIFDRDADELSLPSTP